MYLEHFGLTEPPFKITPVTEFFFSGANRGEILDALIYAINDSEGIIKISGEVGSGKTMLCRMLLNRLPNNIKAIYLANPSLSRDELLYAIADGLELNPEGQRVSVLLQNLQNKLLELFNQGTRCVVLVDEAHAMPLETLEELRLLYNLQVDKHKLIQIVLFGQPELDEKLEQTNMRQLKDRILHSFNMQPLSKTVIDSYLMFRMRAAGYHGPDIFTPAAVRLIGKASNGLMRRVNILADKSLLAAFVENTHQIETKHVQAAIRDSELSSSSKNWPKRNDMIVAGGVTLITIVLGSTIWMLLTHSDAAAPPKYPLANDIILHPPTGNVQQSPVSTPGMTSLAAASAVAAPQNMPTASSSTHPAFSNVSSATLAATGGNHSNQAETDQSLTISVSAKGTLLQQRREATKLMLSQIGKGGIGIQLFHTEDANPAKLERFLARAKNFGTLSTIYIIPITINKKGGYRILYGAYLNKEAARLGIKNLPQRYKDAFAASLYDLDSN